MKKKLRLVIGIGESQPDGKPIGGWLSKLEDMETGEEIDCIRDITVDFPLKGIVTVNAQIFVADVEVRKMPLPIEHHEK